MKKTVKGMAIGALFAAIAGYVAGILTAPQSGKQTRKDIKDTANRGVHEAERQLKRLHTELNDVINEASERGEKLSGKAKEEFANVVKNTRVAKDKAREVLTALHEGKADDKDLERAVTEARKSVEHLKGYVKNQKRSAS